MKIAEITLRKMRNRFLNRLLLIFILICTFTTLVSQNYMGQEEINNIDYTELDKKSFKSKWFRIWWEKGNNLTQKRNWITNSYSLIWRTSTILACSQTLSAVRPTGVVSTYIKDFGKTVTLPTVESRGWDTS